MKRLLIFVLLIILFFVEITAQRRNGLIRRRNESTGSIVLTLGPDYCFGDPDNSKGLFGPILNQSPLKNWDVSLGFRQGFPSNFAYKAAFSFSNFTGADIKSARGYSFKSSLMQLDIRGEYAYNWGRRYRRYTPNSVYAFLGVGVMRSSADLNYYPKANYLYKVSQEGKFSIAPVIPYGFGYQYDFFNNFSLGAEFNLEYTFSDYIDGFKPPYPQSKSNDVLAGISIVLVYKLF